MCRNGGVLNWRKVPRTRFTLQTGAFLRYFENIFARARCTRTRCCVLQASLLRGIPCFLCNPIQNIWINKLQSKFESVKCGWVAQWLFQHALSVENIPEARSRSNVVDSLLETRPRLCKEDLIALKRHRCDAHCDRVVDSGGCSSMPAWHSLKWSCIV